MSIYSSAEYQNILLMFGPKKKRIARHAETKPCKLPDIGADVG